MTQCRRWKRPSGHASISPMTHPKAHSVLARRLATFGAIGALLAVTLSTSSGFAASPSAAPAASPAGTTAPSTKPTPSVTAAPAATPAATAAAVASSAPAACVPTADTAHSVARIWDEAALDAIRRDLPRPTVHARNLFHLSAAMWDAWAAYDPVASGYFVTEKLTAADPAAARAEAISYAAYRVLTERYAAAIGGPDSLAEFDATMASLCYPTDVVSTRRRQPGRAGQPHRRRRHRRRPGRRIQRGQQLRRARLRAGQQAPGGGLAGHEDESTPTAGSRWRSTTSWPRTTCPSPARSRTT